MKDIDLTVSLTLQRGWEKGWQETQAFAPSLGWRVMPHGIQTQRGFLPTPQAPFQTYRLHHKEDAGSLAALILLRLLAEDQVRITLSGSMFLLAPACNYLARAGFPVDVFFAAGRSLKVFHHPGGRVVAVEASEEEDPTPLLPGAGYRPAGTLLTLPPHARLIGDRASSRVWELAAQRV